MNSLASMSESLIRTTHNLAAILLAVASVLVFYQVITRFILGDAAAKVGRNDQRRVLRAPVDDRLFFAGEAMIPEWATQAPAAYLSGQMAAREVVDELL